MIPSTYEEEFPILKGKDEQIDFLTKLLDISAPRHKIALKQMSGGITNAVFRLDVPHDKHYIVRVYGNNTERIIDRRSEQEHILTINFINIFANFLNGTVVSYIEGRPIDVPMMGDPLISLKIAQKIGKFHKITYNINSTNKENEIFSSIEKFINGLNPDFSTENGEKIDISLLKEKFRALKENMEKELFENDTNSSFGQNLGENKSSIVLCHNDLLAANILWDGEDVDLCDYEYSAYTWPEFDIANHFFEYCGFECDLSRFPSKRQQKLFMRNYLSNLLERGKDELTEKEVDDWIRKVNCLVKLSHFFWGSWGFFQASNSSVKFPYFEYATTRIMLMDIDLPLADDDPLAQEPLVRLN